MDRRRVPNQQIPSPPDRRPRTTDSQKGREREMNARSNVKTKNRFNNAINGSRPQRITNKLSAYHDRSSVGAGALRVDDGYTSDRFTSKYDTPDDMTQWFNVHRHPDFNNLPERYMAFLIFTRPDLNIYDSSGIPFKRLTADHNFASYIEPNTVQNSFTRSLTDKALSNYLPHFTARATKGLRIDGRALKVNEMGETYLGQTIGYAGPSYDHKKSRSLDIEFENDSQLSIYRTVAAWREYIQLITFNHFHSPKPGYIYPAQILDYAASMWYIVTKADARSIVFWQKFVGVFPKSVPDEIFSSGEGPIFEKTVNVSFHCSGVFEPNHIPSLADINTISNVTEDDILMQRYEVFNTGMYLTSGTDSQALAPVIIKGPGNTYFLEWKSPRSIPKERGNNEGDPNTSFKRDLKADKRVINKPSPLPKTEEKKDVKGDNLNTGGSAKTTTSSGGAGGHVANTQYSPPAAPANSTSGTTTKSRQVTREKIYKNDQVFRMENDETREVTAVKVNETKRGNRGKGNVFTLEKFEARIKESVIGAIERAGGIKKSSVPPKVPQVGGRRFWGNGGGSGNTKSLSGRGGRHR